MSVSVSEFVHGNPDEIGFKSNREVAEALLNFKGPPLSLDNYKPMWDVHEDAGRELLLLAGRQVSKSVSIMIKMIAQATTIPFYQQLFVAPLKDQTSRFSKLYINDTIKFSPALKEYFMPAGGDQVKNVAMRSFSNGSVMHFAYAMDNADRVRGLAVDNTFLDEIQDMQSDIIPIILSCMKASKHRKRIFSGTPKTLDNTIEGLWESSTKFEWAMKCTCCGYWAVPNEDYIQQMIDVTAEAGRGIVCPRKKCRKPLDITTGMWVSTGNPEATRRAYHLPQIIFPHNVNDKVGWADFKEDYKGIDGDPTANFTRKQIFNEIFGISYDVGGRIITRRELEECCVESRTKYYKNAAAVTADNMHTTFAGIDWGIGGEKSFTFLSILAPDNHGRLNLVYMQKFPAGDPLQQIAEIVNILRVFKVTRIGSDYGNGYLYNQYIKRELGLDRLLIFQYVSARALISFNVQGGHYTIDRTNVMNLVFMELKQKRVQFPCKKLSELMFADIMSIYEDEIQTTSGGKKVFRHGYDQPDDGFHSLLYATLAYKFHFQDPILDIENITKVYPSGTHPGSVSGPVLTEDEGW